MTDMKAARPEDLPLSTHESEMELMGVKLRLYVLDDGRRVVNAEDFAKLMNVMTGNEAS